LISYLKSKTAKITINLDSKGILHLIKKYISPDYCSDITVSVDTNMGFLPVFCREEVVSPDGTYAGHTIEVSWNWTSYEGQHYLKHMLTVWNGEMGVRYPSGELWEPIKDHTERKEIEIVDFQPNVEVTDLDFTLEGLGLEPGTLVTDYVKEIQYHYQGNPIGLNELEKTLDNTEFVKGLKQQFKPKIGVEESESAIVGQVSLPYRQVEGVGMTVKNSYAFLLAIVLATAVCLLLGMVIWKFSVLGLKRKPWGYYIMNHKIMDLYIC
jgi:hypothetical protein